MMMYLIILVPVLATIVFVIFWHQKGKDHESESSTKSLMTLNSKSGDRQTERFDSQLPDEADAVIPEIRHAADAKVVLIIDDQPAIRMLLREVFELEGVAVYEAPRGRTALEILRRTRIDFILLDLKMPDMDGITVLRGVREINKQVKVAMITAYSDPLQLEEANRLGILTQFTKPFDIGTVKQFVLSNL